jgi:hypothetical protein
VITKVITIGEYAKVGRMHESKGVFISALWKAFVFCLLVFGFHLIEEVVKRRQRGFLMNDEEQLIVKASERRVPAAVGARLRTVRGNAR